MTRFHPHKPYEGCYPDCPEPHKTNEQAESDYNKELDALYKLKENPPPHKQILLDALECYLDNVEITPETVGYSLEDVEEARLKLQ